MSPVKRNDAQSKASGNFEEQQKSRKMEGDSTFAN